MLAININHENIYLIHEINNNEAHQIWDHFLRQLYDGRDQLCQMVRFQRKWHPLSQIFETSSQNQHHCIHHTLRHQ